MKKPEHQDVEAVAREIVRRMSIPGGRESYVRDITTILRTILRRFEREVLTDVPTLVRALSELTPEQQDEVTAQLLLAGVDWGTCDHALQSCAVCDPCIQCGKRVARAVDMYCSDECELAGNPDDGGDDD